ncbi:universal stress protein [Nocardioides halotolerans]|uniref:universal stress protein n=1 Tax=Nocardioides halotolerans TaxID=433660 RepID=UPI000418214A|nr:universal stress protein [Nocardioides halotolerans]
MNDNPGSRPVVVGVDGLPGSAGALRYAICEARRRSTSLRLVHVLPTVLSPGLAVPLPGLRQTGADLLAGVELTARELAPDLRIDTLLTLGERTTGVVGAAEEGQLLVVGRESRRGIERLLTGAATASIAARAPTDVVVVPSFWTEGDLRGRVVAGVKPGRNTSELLAHAFSEAAARGAVLTLVTAWHLTDPYSDTIEARTHADEWVRNGTEILDDVAADWRAACPDVTVETRVVHGPAARVLLGASEGADLLLISRRRLALPPYGQLGGIGHDLLRLSEVPVQVVPYVADPVPVAQDLELEQAGALLK